MANRMRYKDMERVLTFILIGAAVVFVLYLVFAGVGITAMKIITSIIAIVACVLSLAYLYICGELKTRRSRWMVLGFICIAVCLLVSLILNFPAPAIDVIEKIPEIESAVG